MTRVSVIIPTYNNVELFKGALQSVLSQDYQEIEILVSDDSSENGIREICNNSNDDRIRYIRNSPSLGAVINWNQGLKKATGEIVILLHHDERLPQGDYLKTIVELMEKTDVVVSNICVCSGDRQRKDWVSPRLKKIMLSVPVSLFFINYIGPCACVAFKKKNLQFFDERLNWLVDTEWYYRILKNSNGVVFQKDKYVMSIHGHAGQITSNINIADANRADMSVIEKKYSHMKSVSMALWCKKQALRIKGCIKKSVARKSL